MLIKFSLRNFATFREPAEWSLVATDDTTFEEDNVAVVPEFGLRLLKTAVVYGANASGKTKLLQGLGKMKGLVRQWAKLGPDDLIPVEPFRLNISSASESSEFEVTFLLSPTLRCRYGFEVTATHVVAEWLYQREADQVQETAIFYRDEQQIELSEHSGPQLRQLQAAEIVRENELLLYKAADNNSPEARQVYRWFGGLNVITALELPRYRSLLFRYLDDPALKPAFLELVKAADLNIQDAQPGAEVAASPESSQTDEVELDDGTRPSLRATQRWATPVAGREVITKHTLFDDNRRPAGEVGFNLFREESHGTRQLFGLVALLLDTLAHGKVLAVDELDERLHPNLVAKIVALFHSPATNPKNAQLLFNTHDTNLLKSGNFRRDQIWFTKKDRYGAAKLYSLAEFKDVPATGPQWEETYLQGRYGGIPYLGDFDQLMDQATPDDHAE